MAPLRIFITANKGLLAKNTRWFDLYDSWSTKRYFNYFTEYSPTNTEGGKRYHHREVASANLDFRRS